jgi:hypothetical protein
MIVKTSSNKKLITKTSNKKIDRQNKQQWKYDHQDKQWEYWSPRRGNTHQKKKTTTKMRTPRRWPL